METTTREELIDFSRVRQIQVKKLIRLNALQSVNDFKRLGSKCYDKDDTRPYHSHTRTYIVHSNLEKAWQTYKDITPEDAWNGKMVTFGVQYSRKENKIYYPGDAHLGIEAGLIVILNLSILPGIFNMAVAHEVIAVDDQKKQIKICYVEKGASIGTQWISFTATEEGQTRILHETKYRSESRLRDTLLYPRFHEKAINEFHENIRRKIMSAI